MRQETVEKEITCGVVNKSSISLRLPEELALRFQALADNTGRSKTYYMLQALERAIEDLEDIYIAEKTLEDIKAGRSETFTFKEVADEFGLGSDI